MFGAPVECHGGLGASTQVTLRHMSDYINRFTDLIPFQSPALSQPKKGQVPAIRDTAFPTPLAVRTGATSSKTVQATENGHHILAI